MSLRFSLAGFLIPRDEETVENYGIQNGQTVHCMHSPPCTLIDFDIGVQTQAPATVVIGASSGQIPQANQSGQPPQQIPSNLASGAGAFNPFAGLTGARYAGQVPLPNISMFGPDRIPRTSKYLLISQAANQLPPSPEQMQELMNQVVFYVSPSSLCPTAWISTEYESIAGRSEND